MVFIKELYSIKMRAADKHGRHISGAERIIGRGELEKTAAALLERALNHPRGTAELINIKAERVLPDTITYVHAPKVTTVSVGDWHEGIKEAARLLYKAGISHADEVVKMMKDAYTLRGAMLVDSRTLERLEPNRERGVRATYMDWEVTRPAGEKNHFSEALALSAKVLSCPGIAAELCISDDPDYVTGYVAAPALGYVRITKLKEKGSPLGGRIFLFDRSRGDLNKAIEYIEHERVLVLT